MSCEGMRPPGDLADDCEAACGACGRSHSPGWFPGVPLALGTSAQGGGASFAAQRAGRGGDGESEGSERWVEGAIHMQALTMPLPAQARRRSAA